jgi:hypothetical protein
MPDLRDGIALAGQKLGIEEVDRACPGLDPGYWLVSFNYNVKPKISLMQCRILETYSSFTQ